jgi:hypothetical protein
LKNFLILFVGFTLLVATLLLYRAIRIPLNPVEKTVTSGLNQKQIKSIIDNGSDFLINTIEPNGHFVYEVHAFTNTNSNDDNLIRQTGAFFILGELLHLFKENKYEDTLIKSWSYFRDNIQFVEIDNREIAYLDKDNQSPLGANALLLIGLLNLSQENKDLAIENERYTQGLKNLLLYSIKENGGLRKNFDLIAQKGDKGFDDESDYYNGEGLLSLAKAAIYYDDPNLAQAALNSFNYFEDKYGKNPTVPFYLWGMLSIKELVQLFPEEQERFFGFGKSYTDWILTKSNPYGTQKNNGYMMEGLGVMSLLGHNSSNVENQKAALRYEQILKQRLTELQDWQIDKDDVLAIRLNGEKENILKPNFKAYGCFLNAKNSPLCRIDFTQHALSAYRLLYEIEKK